MQEFLPVMQARSFRSLPLYCAACLIVFALTACSGESGSKYMDEGKKLMEQKNPGGAVVLFKNALEKHPEDFELRLNLGRAYLAMGKPQQADAELQKCLRQNPNDSGLRHELAKLCLIENRYNDALAHIDVIRKNKALTAEILVLEGMIHGLNKDLAKSRASLEQALALEADNEQALLALARLDLSERKPVQALAIVDKVLAKTPDSENALLMRAEMATRMNDLSKAIECYARITKSYPKNEGARYMHSLLLLQTGQPAQAEALLPAMQKDFPDSAMTRMLEGLFAYQRGDLTTAVAAFQRSITIQPSLEGYYRLALTLFQTNNLESAISNARKVLDVAPGHAQAHRLICSILLRQNRLDDALQEANRLLERHPDDAENLFLLGSIQEAKGNKDDAIRLFERALSIDPNMSQASIRRSGLLMAEGKYAEAEQSLTTAAKQNTGNREALAALVRFHVSRGNMSAAEATLTEALAARPNDAILLTMLAGVYTLQSKETEALAKLTQARAADPAYLAAATMELRLHLAAGRNDKALEICDAVLSQQGNATPFLIMSASLLDLAGKPQEAQVRLQKAFSLGDQRALFILAQRAQAAHKPEEAATLLREALKQTPSPTIRTRLAQLYLGEKKFNDAWALYADIENTKPEESADGKFHLLYNSGKYEEALAEARQIARRDTTAIAGLRYMAMTLERQNRRGEAMEELQKAYSAQRRLPLLLMMAGICARSNELDKAEAYYRTALEQESDNLEALTGRATVLISRKRYNEAMEVYELALRIAPDNPVVTNNLAMAYLETGRDPERALRLAASAYMQQPEHPDILDTLGMCLLANNRPADAVNILERANQSEQPSASRLYRLATALAGAGRGAEALDTVTKALGLGDFPEKEQAEALRQKLNNASNNNTSRTNG